ncbi:MAG: hypothetical protein U1D96_05210 [Eubacteriales bacterium]|nr:hypothetical protein [Bacillota bacterium]MBV1726718.1 hypothetical protein [Desulforudis sp.]MDQ7788971.1 hypothetical protein [Clostridia bacterium]MDZ4042878.1 hypothetical protein [Eubacteriales bacterium]MBV1734687.1 hypothetical protein [Desulforudis sp.]
MKAKPVHPPDDSSPRDSTVELRPLKSDTEPDDVHQRFLRELKRKGVKRVVMRF